MSPATVQTLQVGDLVRFGRNIRKVRRITPSGAKAHRPRRVYMVTFAILRRSWTDRPYTLYTDHELRAGHIQLVKRGVRLRTTKLERLVQQEIDEMDDGQRRRRIRATHMAGLVV